LNTNAASALETGTTQEFTALARLYEDFLYHKLEAGHDISADQDVGFGEGRDVAR
jgi:hypothetical protein